MQAPESRYVTHALLLSTSLILGACGSSDRERSESIRVVQLFHQIEAAESFDLRSRAVNELRDADFHTTAVRRARNACWQTFQATIEAERSSKRAQRLLAHAEQHPGQKPAHPIAGFIKRSEESLKQAKKWFKRCERLRIPLERQFGKRAPQGSRGAAKKTL